MGSGRGGLGSGLPGGWNRGIRIKAGRAPGSEGKRLPLRFVGFQARDGKAGPDIAKFQGQQPLRSGF